MPEGVKPEPLDELAVDVAFSIFDLKNARPDRCWLQVVLNHHRPNAGFPAAESRRSKYVVRVSRIRGIGTPVLKQLRENWVHRDSGFRQLGLCARLNIPVHVGLSDLDFRPP